MKVQLILSNGKTREVLKSELLLNIALNKFEEVKIIGYKMIKNIK